MAGSGSFEYKLICIHERGLPCGNHKASWLRSYILIKYINTIHDTFVPIKLWIMRLLRDKTACHLGFNYDNFNTWINLIDAVGKERLFPWYSGNIPLRVRNIGYWIESGARSHQVWMPSECSYRPSDSYQFFSITRGLCARSCSVLLLARNLEKLG